MKTTLTTDWLKDMKHIYINTEDFVLCGPRYKTEKLNEINQYPDIKLGQQRIYYIAAYYCPSQPFFILHIRARICSILPAGEASHAITNTYNLWRHWNNIVIEYNGTSQRNLEGIAKKRSIFGA